MSSLPGCALDYIAFTSSEEQRYQDVIMQAPRCAIMARRNRKGDQTAREPHDWCPPGKLCWLWVIICVYDHVLHCIDISPWEFQMVSEASRHRKATLIYVMPFTLSVLQRQRIGAREFHSVSLVLCVFLKWAGCFVTALLEGVVIRSVPEHDI